ncbi:MAG TPA: NrfD/PsrC family molybdoenzyme membrane anchor subunit [Gemmatimonadales bacterium]|jgi:molybdopterin-containing oxidoreductase family membrane subunit
MATMVTPVAGEPTYAEVNRDIIRTLDPPGLGWFAAMGVVFVGLMIGGYCFAKQLKYGIGVTGYTPPIFWGTYITTFVFWVGIAHSGTLISAILFLFRSAWRAAVYRAAEAMTVFAVLTAGLFPVLHLGRAWFAYWVAPYPNVRGVWSNFKSPLVWDIFAISTYLTVSATFLAMGLIPDVSSLRDQAVGWRRKVYSVVSLGWRNSDNEWRHFMRMYLFLAGLSTPLVLSVHSVVSWDFAMGIVPGWHATIFAPYFVAGAIYSGCGMVITILVPLRHYFKLQRYLQIKHFENLAKLCILTSSVVGYSYMTEFFIAWQSGNAIERATFYNRVFGQYWWATWTMLTCNVFIPLLLWNKRVRTSLTWLFVISIFVNIGMWFERFVIIVTSLAHEFEPWQWAYYLPNHIEIGIVIGSFSWFTMWFMLFIKFFPSIAISEVKEALPPPMRVTRTDGGH